MTEEQEADDFDKELMADPPKKSKPKKQATEENLPSEPKPPIESESEKVLEEKELSIVQKLFEKISAMEQAFTKFEQDSDLTKRRISEVLEAQNNIDQKMSIIRKGQEDKFSLTLNEIGGYLEEANKTYREADKIFSGFDEKFAELKKDYGMGPRKNATDFCIETIWNLKTLHKATERSMLLFRDKGAQLVELLKEETEKTEED